MRKQLSLPIGLSAILILVSIAAFSITSIVDIEVFDSPIVKELKQKFQNLFAQLPNERLYVQTDKPFYQTGETIWLSAYLRDESTLTPSKNSEIVHIEFIAPKGNVERHLKLVALNGSANADIDLSGLTGGIYKLKAYTNSQKNDSTILMFEKELQVQSSVMPRLKMKFEFDRKAYGSGSDVSATLDVIQNNGKPLSNNKVKVILRVSNNVLREIETSTNTNGKATFAFKLPESLNTTDGIAQVLVPYDGITESISRSIPIVLNQINLEFFPEGGEMISGVPGKIAFKASNEFSKAADVTGIITDEDGRVVANFNSYHFGMGEFILTPESGKKYSATITQPAGISTVYKLPEALNAGYSLTVSPAEKSLQIAIHSWKQETLSIIGQVRGNIVYSGSVNARKGSNVIRINTTDFPMGVAQFTLFDSKGIEQAERLVFVNRQQQLNIQISTNKPHYNSREKVDMDVKVTDENGIPVQGQFSLSVVDDNLLSFADSKDGTILAKILLEPDLKQKVEEPSFYFDLKNERSAKAMDLLMLTSGWRRFTWREARLGKNISNEFATEKTTWGGQLLDAYTMQPVKGADVLLDGKHKWVSTDAEGKFTISRFDITKQNKVEVAAAGYNNLSVQLTEYGTNNQYYLYKRGVYRERFMMDDAMAAPAMGDANQLMEVAAVAKVARAENKKRDWAPVIPDLIERDKTPIEEEATEQKNVESGKIKDARDEIFGASKKSPNQDNGQTGFYRSREFPTKKYSSYDTVRNDMGSTLYWNGNIVTDKSGKARVSFITNDLMTSFKATLEGFADNGLPGHGEHIFYTTQPLVLDVKMPLLLVAGDALRIPIIVKNNSNENADVNLKINSTQQLRILPFTSNLTIPSLQSQTIWLYAEVTDSIGNGQLNISTTSNIGNDATTRNISTTAKGFPATISLSGQEMNKDFVILPKGMIQSSVKVSFQAYPNVMSELMSGVESILREPYGCFEQTSSSNYPNIMVLQYLKTMKVANPTLEAKAKQLLESGYKKLVAFETKENGYEWFGAAPAHEALTAYGLMEFKDMQNVYSGVDEAMIQRTASLLLNKRDGNGGFKKNPKALDSFGGADSDITNAYIVYALSEAGYSKEIEKELMASSKQARSSGDVYQLALVSNALFNCGKNEEGLDLLKQIEKLADTDGGWTGKKHSITRSTGLSLRNETTALVALAALKAPAPNAALIQKAVQQLVNARSGSGGFGSTQATILALKALTKYAEYSKKTDEEGTVEVMIDQRVIGTKQYKKGESGKISIEGLEAFITGGKQKITVRFKGCKNPLPYSMAINYNTTLPASAADCAVKIETKLASKNTRVGETVRLTATLSNTTADGQPMTIAIVGIPAGLSVQPWQLKELQEKKTVDFYEISGNSIALYYRALAPNARKEVLLDLKAEVPGKFESPASNAYLYYTAEKKNWVSGNTITISE